MSSDSTTCHLSVEVTGPMCDFAHLTVFDGYDDRVAKQYGSVSADLPRGTYRVRLELNETAVDKFIRLDKDVFEKMETPEIYSSIPVRNYTSSYEYYSQNAVRWSREITAGTNGTNSTGALFLFFRFPNKTICGELNSTHNSLGKDFFLLDGSRKVLFPLSGENIREDFENGWLAFNALLAPGIYYLHYSGITKREIPLYVFNRWQTQGFMTCREQPLFPSLKLSIEPAEAGFDDKNRNYYIVDAVTQKLHNGIFFIPEKILREIAGGELQNPMIAMLAAYVFINNDRMVDNDLFREVLAFIVNSLSEHKDAPDVIALQVASSLYFDEKIDVRSFETPCMFLMGMKAVVNAREAEKPDRSKKLKPDESNVAQNSLLKAPEISPKGTFMQSVVEKLYNDIVWTSYNPGEISK